MRKMRTLAALMLGLAILGATAPAQLDPVKFREQFEKAADSKDYSTQRNLVQANKDTCTSVCLGWEYEYCKAKLNGTAEESAKWLNYITSLGSVYALAHKSDFITQRGTFVGALSDDGVARRLDCLRFEIEGFRFMDEGKNGGGDQAYIQAQNQFIDAFNNSLKIEDHYNTARYADWVAQTHEKLAEPDIFAVVYFSQMARHYARQGGYEAQYVHIDTRLSAEKGYANHDKYQDKAVTRPELIDLSKDLEEARTAYPIALEESRKVATPTSSGPVNAGGTALQPPKSSAAFEWLDDTEFKTKELPIGTKIILPWYRENVTPENPDYHPTWRGMVVDKDKDPIDSAFIPGGKVKFDGKLHVAVDGSAAKPKFKEIKLKTKPVKQEFDITYDDDSKAKLAFLLTEIPGNSNVFGRPTTDPDAAKHLQYTFLNTTGITGKVRGTDITFIDGNSNSYYNEPGEDAVIIGSGKNARVEPFGRYIFIEEEGGLYPYQINLEKKNAGIVRTRPYNGDLAPLKVEFKAGNGKLPLFLLAKGSGSDSAFYFNLMNAVNKEVWVPVGSYSIHRGMFALDPGAEKTVLIGKGRSKDFDVKIGQLNVWSLGGAGENGFTILGKATRNGDVVECKGKEIHVLGNWGEEYFNFIAERLTVNMEVRKETEDGSKIGSCVMKPFTGEGNFTIADLFWPAKGEVKGAPKGAKLYAKWSIDHGILGKIESKPTLVED